MLIKQLIEIYQALAIMTAVVLFIRHLIYPYSYHEGFPYDDPPPKFLGPFSVGELVQYVIQVLTFPLAMLAMIPLQFLGKAAITVLFILLYIWWAGPRTLARKIDGW